MLVRLVRGRPPGAARRDRLTASSPPGRDRSVSVRRAHDGSPIGRAAPGRCAACDRRARVDAHRRDRIRRAAGAHRAAAPPDGRSQALDGRARVRGRQRRLRPPARPRLDAARDLLRLSRRRSARARSSAGSDSSLPGRRARPAALGACSSGTRRRSGSAARAPARARRSPPSPSHAALSLLVPSYERVRGDARAPRPLGAYLVAAGAAAALIGPYLVLVLLGCGLIELALQRRPLVSPGCTGPRSRRWRRGPSRSAAWARSAGPRSRSARSPTAAAS